MHDFSCHLSKGNPVNIPEPECRSFNGNVNELGDTGKGPGKSYLFSLTAYNPEISLSGDRVQWLVELDNSVGSGASLTVLENPRE